MIPRSRRRRWLPLVGATAALALLLAGCGDDAPAATDPTTTTTAAATGSTAASTTTAAPAATDSLLTDGLAGIGERYAFTASVTLDGVETTHVQGTVYDGAGSYTVTSGGTMVDYVIAPEGQWAREPGSPWRPLAGAAPLSEPIGPLMQPLSVTVLERDGANALLEAVYAAATLGFDQSDDVTVTVTIDDGIVTSIRYDVAVGGGTATVVTTFDTTADLGPIPVPPG